MLFRQLGWVCLTLGVTRYFAQRAQAEGPFDRKTTWTVLADYSNTSSHIIAGAARQRELVTLGGAYTRRMVRFWGTSLGYRVELRPLVFESDPVQLVTTTYTGMMTETFTGTSTTVDICRPYTQIQTIPEPAPNPPEVITITASCGRQWTFGQAFAPFGVQYVFGYRHRVQPYLIGTLGYMYTSRPVPVSGAESFNFVIDSGAGVDIFRAGHRSIAVEVRAHHFSNRKTAPQNPGTDNVMYGVAYSFGR